jgi:hypothetical protein
MPLVTLAPMALEIYHHDLTNRVTTSWLLRTFGERQMMAELIARRGLTSPLINKDFRVCHLLLARGEFVSVHLNYQTCARAQII